MLTHADQPVDHPVQMAGQPRRRYLAGALAITIGTLAAMVAFSLFSVSATAMFSMMLLSCCLTAAGRYLVNSAMWHVRTENLDRLPQWPAWARLGLEIGLSLVVVALSMRFVDAVTQLVWVMVATTGATMAVGNIARWLLMLAPRPRWLATFTGPGGTVRDAGRSALRFTLVAVLIGGTVWMHYDAAAVTEWEVSAAQSAGWSQQRIDAIPETNYGIAFAVLGAFLGAVVLLLTSSIRALMGKPKFVAR